MAPRSSFIKSSNVSLTKIQQAFEDWLLKAGYRAALPLSASGVDAAQLVEDFIEETDLDVGVKRKNQLERHAHDIGLVVWGYNPRGRASFGGW